MYNKLITSDFRNKNYNQNINQKLIIDASKYCYENFAFSTFPYIVEELSSKQSCDKLNSGNCISMSMFMKKILKEKYDIESFLIPATIPKNIH